MSMIKELRNHVNNCKTLKVIVMQNKRNENKFLEIHRTTCRHTTVRQFMRWIDTKNNNKEIINYTGDGNLHRWKNEDLKEFMKDYKIYTIIR